MLYSTQLFSYPTIDANWWKLVIMNIVSAAVISIKSHFTVDTAVSFIGEFGVEVSRFSHSCGSGHFAHSGAGRQTYLCQSHLWLYNF